MPRALLLLAFVLNLSLPSGAATLFHDSFSPQQPGWSFPSPSADFLGELHDSLNVAAVSLTVVAPNADPNAVLEFDLLGFRSIDGTNCCTDTLTLTINGVVAFTGAWTYNDVYSTFFTNPAGASFQPAVIGGPGPSGVAHHITVPHAVVAGANTYTWSYSQLQDPTDEAWGLDEVRLSGDFLRYRLPFVGGPIDITNAPDCGGHKPRGAVDYALPNTYPVIASERGTVVFAGTDPTDCLGQQVVLEHPEGRRTRYAHLSQMLTAAGAQVQRGDVIARSGNSTGTLGRCKPLGFHLHFELIAPSGAQDVPLISTLPGTTWYAGPGARRLCLGHGTVDGTATGQTLPD
ncbi:MAG TPA: M23 family metallopeptidase [Thermoanaerobaculia bacterium]|nr:M23 family metallopeptidase [Thermoanaerobaculia bacterium]